MFTSKGKFLAANIFGHIYKFTQYEFLQDYSETDDRREMSMIFGKAGIFSWFYYCDN